MKRTTSARTTNAREAEKRDPEGTKRRILEAATQEFSRSGLGGARVEQIAKAADTNERMLYYYYGSKEGLYRAALEQAYLNWVAAERTLELDHKEPLAAIKELVEFTWNYYIDHPEFIRLVNSENLHEARHLRTSQVTKELVSPIIEILAGILKRGQAQGVFRADVDPTQCYITIAALGYFFLSNRYTLSQTLNRNMASEQARAEHLAHNTQVILTYLTSKPEA